MSHDVLVDGVAEGELVVLSESISLWGGFDPSSGEVIDVSHPDLGLILTGKVVAMVSGRGSSSASTVLAEAMRLGTAPAAFILTKPDPILAIGSLVGHHLYQANCPIVVGPIPEGFRVRVAGATVESL